MRSTIIVDCSVVDPVAERTRADMGIWVKDGRVMAVGAPDDVRAEARSTPDTEVVELGGAYVLPGLINMHVHLGLTVPGMPPETPAERALRAAHNAKASLEAGVTTIRSTGSADGADFALRNAIRKGYAVGPRIFTAGSVLAPTAGHGHGSRPGAPPGPPPLNGVDDFLRGTREQIAAGADLIKVAISGGIGGPIEQIGERHLTDDEMKAITWVAHARGKKVTAHAGPSEAIGAAVDCGFDCIEHGYYLSAEVARKMAAHRTWLVPTLSVTRCFEFYERTKAPAYVFEKAGGAADRHWKGFQAALAAGVPIAMGTDLMPAEPFDETSGSVREIELMVEAGMSPAAALRSATCAAAEWLGASAEIGTLDAGRSADLIGVGSDPLRKIAGLRELRFVMKAGVRYPAVGAGPGFSLDVAR